jgi:phosphonate transport system ATP-binding protein
MQSCQLAAMNIIEIPHPTVVDVRGVSKRFGRGAPVLDDVSLFIKRGEMVALIGASGSGKSTLIRSIAGLLPIDRGAGGEIERNTIRLFEKPMQRNGRIDGGAREMRSRTGVIFQQFNLVPRLTVLTNVCLGRLGRTAAWRGTLGRFTMEEQMQAMRALDRVGMAEHALKRGCDLSGGQQQRAAIARTLVQGAELLIADEPIASLDPASARRVMDILADMNRHDGITVLVSLHQVEYALKYCPRTIALKAGKIVYDGASTALTPAELATLYGAECDDVMFGTREPSAAWRRHDGSIPHLVGNGPIPVTDPRHAPVNDALSAHAWPHADRRTA